MSQTGDYFFSKYKGAGTRTFYHSNRKTIALPTCAKVTPGPGHYRAPSEFGIYENKRKFIKSARATRNKDDGLKGSNSQPELKTDEKKAEL